MNLASNEAKGAFFSCFEIFNLLTGDRSLYFTDKVGENVNKKINVTCFLFAKGKCALQKYLIKNLI